MEALRRTLLEHFRAHGFRLVQPPLVVPIVSVDTYCVPPSTAAKSWLRQELLTQPVADKCYSGHIQSRHRVDDNARRHPLRR